MPTLINKVTEQVVVLDEIGSFLTDIIPSTDWIIAGYDGAPVAAEPEPEQLTNEATDGDATTN